MADSYVIFKEITLLKCYMGPDYIICVIAIFLEYVSSYAQNYVSIIGRR